MSDNIRHLDLEDDEFYDAPKALRDYAKSLKKALESTSTELTKVRGTLASQALGEVLSGQGYKNPKRVEKDLLADGVDPLDKSAVDGWLAEFGDDYARGEAAAQQPTEQAPETPVASDEEQAAFRQLQQAQGDLKAPADMNKVEAASAEMTKDMTGADFIALAKKHGL